MYFGHFQLTFFYPYILLHFWFNNVFFFLQVATALLVAGSTLTFWIPLCASTSSYPSVVQSARLLCNCRRLTRGSFQLTHMSRDDHAVQLIEPWRSERRQNIITALTTLPQGWVSTHKHQCKTAITTMQTESSWAFPESYTADDSWIVRSSDGEQREDKRAHNSTIKVSFCTIIVRLCHCMIVIMTV